MHKPKKLCNCLTFFGIGKFCIISTFLGSVPVSYTHLLTVQLGHLLNKDKRWQWNLKEQNIFELIKDKFLNTVILAHPNFAEPFYIHTDASNIALGVELFQLDGSGNHIVVALSLIHI